MVKRYFRIGAALTLIGALLVGVIGNALWELLFKPILLWISTLILNIATLGINSLRDDLYSEMAKGLFDRSGYETFSLIVASGTTLLFGLAVGTPMLIRIVFTELLDKINLVKAVSARPQSSLPTPSRLFRWLRWSLIAFVGIMTLQASLLVLVLTRHSFISRGAVYLDQSQRIVAAYISEDERVVLRSRAAQMRSRADFDSLNGDLLKVAERSKVQMPSFAPF